MIKQSSSKMLGIAVAVTLAFAGCGDNAVDSGPNEFGPNPRDVVFDASLGIDLDAMTETPSGLFYLDDPVGTGELAATGDLVTLTYTGWLVDGTEFDSRQLNLITVGPGYIPGFTEGIIGMQKDGTRKIVIPASLAYGAQGLGNIPPNAVIVFEITLTMLIKA